MLVMPDDTPAPGRATGRAPSSGRIDREQPRNKRQAKLVDRGYRCCNIGQIGFGNHYGLSRAAHPLPFDRRAAETFGRGPCSRAAAPPSGPFAVTQLDLRVLAISGDAHPQSSAEFRQCINARQRNSAASLALSPACRLSTGAANPAVPQRPGKRDVFCRASPALSDHRKHSDRLAGGLGFEPRLAESESAVLPLDDPPSAAARRGLHRTGTYHIGAVVGRGSRPPAIARLPVASPIAGSQRIGFRG